MADNQLQEQAERAMNVMATAAKTLREAISTNLPVANTQLMTVSIPGTVLNYKYVIHRSCLRLGVDGPSVTTGTTITIHRFYHIIPMHLYQRRPWRLASFRPSVPY